MNEHLAFIILFEIFGMKFVLSCLVSCVLAVLYAVFGIFVVKFCYSGYETFLVLCILCLLCFIRFFIPYFCQFMMIYVQQEVRLLFELSETELDRAYKKNPLNCNALFYSSMGKLCSLMVQ